MAYLPTTISKTRSKLMWSSSLWRLSIFENAIEWAEIIEWKSRASKSRKTKNFKWRGWSDWVETEHERKTHNNINTQKKKTSSTTSWIEHRIQTDDWSYTNATDFQDENLNIFASISLLFHHFSLALSHSRRHRWKFSTFVEFYVSLRCFHILPSLPKLL